MIPDECLQTFVVECSELLEQMEEALLSVEQAEDDPEIINAIFRAAHTIKGSAGMFGIDPIVVFTHAAESVLDRVRSGDIAMSSVLAALFIEAHDHLSVLINHVAVGSQPDSEIDSHGKSLIAQLEAYLGETAASQPNNSVPVVHESKLEREQSDMVGTDHWHLSLRFGPEVFRNGMDPFSFVRCLSSLGRIMQLETLIDAIPAAEQMDPETCYLGFEISFSSDADKLAIDSIFNFVRSDCLTHLVRNSMDHGIEPAELRIARGKPAKGTLKLNAYHDAGSIVIEVSDDGGGLNKEKIINKAIERGLVSEGAILTDKEIYNLIFEAGFSTADAVSNLSGRGVGMDVVRRNIQALRGSVDLDSVEGQGSTIRIRLPLTLAIIDGFMVGVGNASYVIPLDMVVECIELRAWANDEEAGQYLNLRGEVLPYQRLRDHFDIAGDLVQRENVVVVRYGEHKAGLVVDKLMGEFQTVIKPLCKPFKGEKSIGGFTILGSGEVALIVDVPGLMRQIEHEREIGKMTVAAASK